ncbi:endolytic transglycosylase MltG [Catenovulum agarivorans]|uniref:endolytic transglycosylase MltG n=1 Tax=Catenovulum agarivorans TaxID=1172192 RepID=UPI0002D974AF|nr:endolytic transglycosylase MltG [Catenovulum agarivorans]
MVKWFSRVLLALVLIISIACSIAYNQVKQDFSAPIELQQQLITINQGASFQKIIQQLMQQQLLPNSQLLHWYLRIQARLQPDFAQLKQGTYLFDGQYSAQQVLAKIRNGEQHLFSITFAEGSTFAQIQAVLQNHPQVQQTDYQTWLAEQIKPHLHAEGLLFPDTYLFAANTKDKTILAQALNKMAQLRDSEFAPLAEPKLSWYQTLILASIIEKETPIEAEMPTVASVFYNRLAKKMRLQTDPTVIYGLGAEYQGDITRAHLKQATPYNTYVIKGLPPTPISMPGLAAIKAALAPADTDYFYFVASGDGGHVFSKTLRQHNLAVAQYLKKLKAEANN